MRIAIDIDGVISEYPAFFQLFSNTFAGRAEIFIITNRDPSTEAITASELTRLGIYYDHLVITPNKAGFIIKNGIEVLFENTDEYFLSLPPEIAVCKVREPGNFNYKSKKWIYSQRTGEDISANPCNPFIRNK